MNSLNFSQLGLSSDLVDNLTNIGFTTPTEIQAKAIPAMLEGTEDILGLAQTGTGKTASFALPIIEQVNPQSKTVQALILAPTRELAKQITDEMLRLKGKRALSILPVYGGQGFTHQLSKLREGVHIVVGTPGRVIDLLKRKSLKIDNLSHLVLDEADDMLNMGFIEDVETILEFAPDERRMLLFSATMPPRLKQVVSRYMKEKIEINLRKDTQTTSLTNQTYYEMFARDKFEVLKRLIDAHDDFYGIVFCRTKMDVDELNQKLTEQGYPSDALHGDISQQQREKIIQRFRKESLKILIATDVASRGVDIQGLTWVVNFSLPNQPEAYVHRVGRTGRAGKTGNAVSFVTPGERRLLTLIRTISKVDIQKKDWPSVDDIMQNQKSVAIKKLGLAVESLLNHEEESKKQNNHDHYFSVAKQLLEELPPSVAVAAALKIALTNLDDKKYKPIEVPSSRRERRFGKGGNEGRRGNGSGRRGRLGDRQGRPGDRQGRSGDQRKSSGKAGSQSRTRNSSWESSRPKRNSDANRNQRKAASAN